MECFLFSLVDFFFVCVFFFFFFPFMYVWLELETSSGYTELDHTGYCAAISPQILEKACRDVLPYLSLHINSSR